MIGTSWKVTAILGLLALQPIFAQEVTNAAPPETSADDTRRVKWICGPTNVPMEDISSIELPEGLLFTDAEGAKEMMQELGNLISDREIGLIAPASTNENWWLLFEFDEIGYVKDDDRKDLDADALLKKLRKGQAKANQRRKEKGLKELEIVGWYKKPFYNEKTHNLEWCTVAREKGTEGEEFVNYNIRILGRYGVTRITLISSIEELDRAVPVVEDLLSGYEYQPGKRYAEFRKGDPVAKYGLAALVVGGATAVALKTGLFKYIWKGLVLAAVAVGSLFKRIFGRKKTSAGEQ